MYKSQNGGKDFTFMHCFKKLEGCKKWDAIRLTLNKDCVGEDGPVTAATASVGRPIGNKKAKAERNAVPGLAAMDASFDKMMSSFSTENKAAADRQAAIWSAILQKQDQKMALEKERVEAAKMEAAATTIKVSNEAIYLSLAKMIQEA